MNDLEKMLADIKKDSGLTDPEQIAMLARVATRAMKLAALAAAGINVDDEVAVLKATVLNISERARSAVMMHVVSFLNTAITSTLSRLLL